MKLVLVLDNIRSVHNVGAIFRTADAAGVDKIYLCGYTPTPLDRFGRVRKDLHKAALGAEKTVTWEACHDISIQARELKKEGYIIVALEQDPNSVDYKIFKPKGKVALVLGNEIDGVSREVLELADKIIEIPMKGKKESLNVSVAAGVALFHLAD